MTTAGLRKVSRQQDDSVFFSAGRSIRISDSTRGAQVDWSRARLTAARVASTDQVAVIGRAALMASLASSNQSDELICNCSLELARARALSW